MPDISDTPAYLQLLDRGVSLQKEIERLEAKYADLIPFETKDNLIQNIEELKAEKEKLVNDIAKKKDEFQKHLKEFEDEIKKKDREQTIKSLQIIDDAREHAEKVKKSADEYFSSKKSEIEALSDSVRRELDKEKQQWIAEKTKLESVIKDLCNVRDELKGQIDVLSQDIITKKQDIENKEKELNLKLQNLESESNKIKEEEDSFARWKTDVEFILAEKDKSLKETLKQLEFKERVLNERKMKLDLREEELQKKETALRETEAELSKKELDIKNAGQEMSKIESSIIERLKEVHKREDDLRTNWEVYEKAKKKLDFQLRQLNV